MKKTKKDREREDRIDEIAADANGEDEVAMGWFVASTPALPFPLKRNKKNQSPRCAKARK